MLLVPGVGLGGRWRVAEVLCAGEKCVKLSDSVPLCEILYRAL